MEHEEDWDEKLDTRMAQTSCEVDAKTTMLTTEGVIDEWAPRIALV
jgi:hypothetical protein